MRLPSLVLLLAVAACDEQHGPPPPPSEFLVAAGDSTFWITSGDTGISVRGAPIALARLDGRLYELYVTDDDRSFYEAIMIGARIYRRDLLTGDSTAVVEDTTVAKLATAYAAAHPDERRLDPNEDPSDDPDLYATADLEIVGVHGPYLSFEHHSDIGLPDGTEIHSIRRGVVDMRTSAPQTTGGLFGPKEGARVVSAARRAYASGIDSLLTLSDPEAQELARAIRDLRLDPVSFSVDRIGQEPAVTFLIPGEGDWATDLALPMAPIAIGAPPWWAEVRPSLPTPVEGSLSEVWNRAGTGVLARLDESENLVTIVLRDSTLQEWKAARVPSPVDHILWLDAPPIDSVSRRVLRRAFDDAALYSADTRIAAHSPRPVEKDAAFRVVSYHPPRAASAHRSTIHRGAAFRRSAIGSPRRIQPYGPPPR
jgi:hypothetical protein